MSCNSCRCETWAPCPGHELKYAVSTHGRVVHTRKGNVLRPSHLTQDYSGVCLDGKTEKVHRLVAKAFLPNPLNLPHINHKDFNRRHNCADNLEWTTPKLNFEHSRTAGRIDPVKLGQEGRWIGKKLTWEQVQDLRRQAAQGERRSTLASRYGIHIMTVGEILRNEIWPE